jgi:hypothetical protein
MHVLRTLQTKAVSECQGKRFEHTVQIVTFGGLPDRVLMVVGTPGQWYLSTLAQRRGDGLDGIPIDGGQEWNLLNLRALLRECEE